MEPPDLHGQVVQADTPDPQNIDKLKSKFILYVAEFYIPTFTVVCLTCVCLLLTYAVAVVDSKPFYILQTLKL